MISINIILTVNINLTPLLIFRMFIDYDIIFLSIHEVYSSNSLPNLQ